MYVFSPLMAMAGYITIVEVEHLAALGDRSTSVRIFGNVSAVFFHFGMQGIMQMVTGQALMQRECFDRLIWRATFFGFGVEFRVGP